MKKTDIIFSFDTEDFTSSTAADAIFREAEILREEGVRGGFCIVGLLAKQLKAWGRNDIREALGHHDILTHSYGHSLHPTINEYTDIADFRAASNELLRQEREGIRMITEFTGRTDILGACPPGNQKSYVAMYTYKDMGLPIYADTFCDTENGRGVYYCNIYHTSYAFSLEHFLGTDDSDEEMRRILDVLSRRERAICYTHPNMAMYEDFWDRVNYNKENKHPFGEWEEAPRLPVEKTERFYDSIRRFIRLIKSDERFRITSYGELAERLRAEPPRRVSRDDLPRIKEELRRALGPIASPSLSVADVFLACRAFLLGEDTHTGGRVHGFLEAPHAVSEPLTVTRKEMIASATAIDPEEFLPPAIRVGEVTLGPADWLMAALDILTGEERATVLPKPQLPSLDMLPGLKAPSLYPGWLQSDRFEDCFLSERLRLQSWTMRFLDRAGNT